MRASERILPQLLTGAWSERARCRGADPRLFYAPFGELERERLERESDVKARYCAHCDVVAQCRDWARAHREYGVWGGESEAERADEGYGPALSRGYPNRRRVAKPK